MAKDIFHTAHNHQHVHVHSNDFSSQILNLIKFAIFFLVFVKLVQLIFMKYRKKLTLPERVEKKYKTSHSDFIDNFSEKEVALMKTTIDNTIQNTQVKEFKKVRNVKKYQPMVSFETAKNCYYDFTEELGKAELNLNEKIVVSPEKS